MKSSTKTLRESRNEAASAMNYYAAVFGKGPTFDLEPAPAAKPRGERKPQPGPEAGVLAAVIKYLQIHPQVAWVRRMNSGSFVIGSGISRRYIRAGFKGCADILGQLRDGRFLAVEVKAERGRVSPEQQAFIDAVIKNNGCAGVVRSISDAETLLKQDHIRRNHGHG